MDYGLTMATTVYLSVIVSQQQHLQLKYYLCLIKLLLLP